MDARVHVIIHGHVQGVFFRSFVRSEASLLKLKGWVRNTEQGQVEAIFEGEKDQVKEMIELCKEGPPNARVGDIRIDWQEYNGGFTEFEIR